jgi:threonine dehydratase
MVITDYPPVTADDIHTAAERIAGITHRTPLLHSDYLSNRYNADVSFKLENLQRTGAFKLRGAYNKIASLNNNERAHGLIAASSGNHAQGVAYAARSFGLDDRTRIYMPESTPQTKVDSTRRYGNVEVVFVDGTYDDAARAAHHEADTTGATYIEPYNDPDIIAGQGTIGLEIMHDAPQTDVIIVPVGGGGLISGIALAAHDVNPDVQLFGIQADYAQSGGYTIADGIRVKQPGDLPCSLIQEHVQALLRVDETDIAEAVRLLAQHIKLVVEGSGAIGLAALETGVLSLDDIASTIPASDERLQVVIVLSGGNIDLKRWQAIVSA